jgi:hypothetical protein
MIFDFPGQSDQHEFISDAWRAEQNLSSKRKDIWISKQRKQDDFDLKLRVASRLIIVLPASIQLDPESLENNTGSYLPVTGDSIIRVFNG